MKRTLKLLLFVALVFPVTSCNGRVSVNPQQDKTDSSHRTAILNEEETTQQQKDSITQKEQYDQAQELWGDAVAKGAAENYEKAFVIFNQLAEQGYTDAYRSLGLCYEYGYGCKQDDEKTMYWYRKAADNGNESALIWLGDIGEKWNRKFCENYFPKADDADDVFYINEMFDEEYDEAEHNRAKKYWYRNSAIKGDANAQYMMGYYYDLEDNPYRDKEAASYWYKKAAKQGHSKAKKHVKH